MSGRESSSLPRPLSCKERGNPEDSTVASTAGIPLPQVIFGLPQVCLSCAKRWRKSTQDQLRGRTILKPAID